MSDAVSQIRHDFGTKVGGLPVTIGGVVHWHDRAAFGFSRDEIKTLMPGQLSVKWKDDYDNVVAKQKDSGLSKEAWAKKINLSEPIDVIYEDGKFKVDDGYHRFYAATILGKPI
jgi:hypothetical protein